VLAVARSIARHMTELPDHRRQVDVPVGTADRVASVARDVLHERHLDLELDVVSNPEFLKEGAAIEDFMRPDRIVVGTDNPAPRSCCGPLRPFNRNHDRVLVMDVRSAELTKYAANAMLATKISFMNELSNIAERVGADIERVRVGIGSTPHRLPVHLPGCGYGGSCFPKDVRASSRPPSLSLLRPDPARRGGREHPPEVGAFREMRSHYGGNLQGKTIGAVGLASSQHRRHARASSRVLMEASGGGRAGPAYDRSRERRRIGSTGPAGPADLQEPRGSPARRSALAVVTEWIAFRSPDFARLGRELHDRVVFDGRNIYDPRMLPPPDSRTTASAGSRSRPEIPAPGR